jgi:predicted O-methyltransferase YrrM
MTNIDKLLNETQKGCQDISKHILTLFTLAISTKAKNILELGVRKGNSTEPLLIATELNNGQLTSVDISWDQETESKYNGSSHWKYIISDSIEFLSSIPSDIIYDLIFIDDWHDGKHVLKELNLLESHITTSSLILLHDTMHPYTHPKYHEYIGTKGEFGNGGPYWAIKSLDKNKWEYCTIPYDHGLTILRKLDNDIIGS